MLGQIEFVNHSSLLITFDQYLILTDPWAISPAFGTWFQSPSPPDYLIQKINHHDPTRLLVVISHGHDDHLDEMWLSKDLCRSRVIIPGLPNQGLARRVERIRAEPPMIISDGGLDLHGIRLIRFQNPAFTESDAIVLIQTPEFNVIHANDNWHEFPPDLINSINEELAFNSTAESIFFVQFGIADCFPICHQHYDDAERFNIIDGRFREFARATEANLSRLNCKSGYYYANQSRFQPPIYWTHGSTYDLAQDFLREHETSYTQLRPGFRITASGDIDSPPESQPFLDAQLQRLETFVNARLINALPVRLTIAEDESFHEIGRQDKTSQDCVELSASRLVWSRILNGELTLEAVVIGGAGLIFRPQESITSTHRQLSSISYVAQSHIRKFGLSAFQLESEF